VSIQVDSGTTGGTGSGVVLRSDGYVLTNNHVVTGGGSITVSFSNDDQTDRPARVVGVDPETDLAVIKVIGGPPLVPATLGSSSDLVGVCGGQYTVTADVVTDGAVTYVPNTSTQTVTVTAGTTMTVAIIYVGSSGPLNLRVDGLTITQVVQTYAGAVPLINHLKARGVVS